MEQNFRTSRRRFVESALPFAMAAGLMGRQESARPAPNILVILADDLGYGDPSCYGNAAYETPNIDRLAAAGTRFTDFHDCGAVCLPSRVGLLTGHYQQRSGIMDAKPRGFKTRDLTFADVLKKAGYATGIVGKWHIGTRAQDNPLEHGFDYFRGYVTGAVDYISHYSTVKSFGNDWWDGRKRSPETGYTTHLITKHARQFIEDHRSRPFCLYVAHAAPHTPYQGPNDPPTGLPESTESYVWPRDMQHIIRARREMVQELDREVGELLDTVKRLGLSERTFIFFFSDNGAQEQGSNGPIRGFKDYLYEGGIRVPAIASWPGKIPAGKLCRELTINLDLFPTFLSLAGVNAPEGYHLDGTDLLPLLREGKTVGDRRLYWWFQGPLSRFPLYVNDAAMREGPWKLLVRQREDGEELTLYHFAMNLSEQSNYAPLFPDRVRSMRAALEEWRKEVGEGSPAPQRPVRPDGSLMPFPKRGQYYRYDDQ